MNALYEAYYYLTPVGWRRSDSPDLGATRYEAWLVQRYRRVPWARARIRWHCLWVDVTTLPAERADLRTRYPFPSLADWIPGAARDAMSDGSLFDAFRFRGRNTTFPKPY